MELIEKRQRAFKKITKRVLSESGQDYYHALGYYLNKSKSSKYFQLQQNRKPSEHSWINNVRMLMQKLDNSFEKMVKFLDWCVENHFHPRRDHLKRFLSNLAVKFKSAAPICACCKKEKTLIHTMCKDCSSLTDLQREGIKNQTKLYHAGASLTAFGKWNNMSSKLLKGFKSLVKRCLDPIGEIQGQYRNYEVYDKRELRLMLDDMADMS
jgi:hypothetical protein